jgi:hypothetical protein
MCHEFTPTIDDFRILETSLTIYKPKAFVEDIKFKLIMLLSNDCHNTHLCVILKIWDVYFGVLSIDVFVASSLTA